MPNQKIRPRNIPTTATAADITSGNYTVLDTHDNLKKLDAGTLLQVTAQNALAGNIVKEFSSTEQTVAGRLYSYNGTIFRCKTTYTGSFDETKFFTDSGINGVGFATYGIVELPNDLNDCYENIVYVCTDNEIGSSVLHKPDESNYFILYTIPTKVNARIQYYIGFNNRNVIYMRSFWGEEGWSDWLKISDTDESALHNVGAINATMAAAAPYNDLDTFPINEVGISINSYSAIAHKPTDEAFNAFTFGGTNGGKCQVVSTSTNKMFMRSCWAGTWSDWVEVTETDQKALHNVGGINATMAAAAPYNDLDTFPINEVGISINSYSAIAHKPTDEEFNAFTFGGTNGGKCQVVSTNTNKMFMRSCWAGTWSDWVEIGKEEEDETFIDVLNQFDNIVCLGDSLTWSQVYTSAKTSRQAKKTYPAVLGEIAHATTEVLAYPGDKTVDAWTRWKDTFESKTNALAIIFLGTNGGFTDTLSTDCPVGVDYSQWADTNTGCYGKIISKLKELGYKIILIQPFAVGQTSNLTITQKVVTDAGARFGCAVVQSFRTTEDKYHYYPDGTGKNTLHYNDFGYSWFAYTLCEKVNNLDNDNMKLIIPS